MPITDSVKAVIVSCGVQVRKRQWFKLVGPLYSWLLERSAIQLVEGGIDVRVNFDEENESGKPPRQFEIASTVRVSLNEPEGGGLRETREKRKGTQAQRRNHKW